ncbi:MAG: exopolysaccharide biosynthesis protein [Alphaproteobacteria bacterium]|nr:exopolysaccharide biosynthesis protein [Alphaproteobacteria bacterium]
MIADSSSPDQNVDVLTDIIDRLDEQLDEGQLSVDDVLDAFEDRSFGALYTVIGLIAAAPVVGAIPGMSIITGTLIFLIAIQHAAGRKHPWIPRVLRDRSIGADKLEKATEKVRPYARAVDRHVRPRLNWVISGVLQRRFAAVVICMLALTMIPLALVPWGVQPPATAILLFGVAMMGRDGVFATSAYLLVGLTAYLAYYFRDTIISAVSYVFGL